MTKSEIFEEKEKIRALIRGFSGNWYFGGSSLEYHYRQIKTDAPASACVTVSPTKGPVAMVGMGLKDISDDGWDYKL